MWDFSKIEFFNREQGSIACICGESGAGKSYLANKLRKEHTIVIDGDAVRFWVNNDLGYSDEDRRTNNERVAGMAIMLAKQGFDVIVSTVRADIAYGIIHKEISNSILVKLEEA